MTSTRIVVSWSSPFTINPFCSLSTRVLKIRRKATTIFCIFSLRHTILYVDIYKKVSLLCLGRPTAVSWRFGYEDYSERRVFANKLEYVFTEFHNKRKIAGRLFSRNIEWCKAGCLFFTSFNEYMCLMVKLGTVPSNFVKSMKLNVDVIGKKRKVEQDRRTCI